MLMPAAHVSDIVGSAANRSKLRLTFLKLAKTTAFVSKASQVSVTLFGGRRFGRGRLHTICQVHVVRRDEHLQARVPILQNCASTSRRLRRPPVSIRTPFSLRLPRKSIMFNSIVSFCETALEHRKVIRGILDFGLWLAKRRSQSQCVCFWKNIVDVQEIRWFHSRSGPSAALFSEMRKADVFDACVPFTTHVWRNANFNTPAQGWW